MMKFFRGEFLKVLCSVALLLAGLNLPLSSSYAEASQIMKLKANFVNIFTNYVQNSSGNKTICVSGDDELLGVLKSTAKKASVQEVTSPAVDNCSLVFIGQNSAAAPGDIIKNADKKSIVTVSDKNGFIGEGGLVELYEKEGKIKFALNLKKAAIVKVKFDSKLVELADKTL